ncbi:MAG: HAMP domain-containing histidine kinase [Bacteroidales bacterium]|nr:HAMP domain-containing histidine kinase [Bacteroidales bacterium]MDD6001286.1 HAMP domain-containing sensor histidine kinase [Bacteroidales bacterium]
MNTREIIKTSIFVLAILVSIASWLYTNSLVNKLKEREQHNISLWAEAINEIENVDFDGTVSLIVYRIIQENTTIPVIMMTSDNRMHTQNLAVENPDEDFLQSEMERMRENHPPLIIESSPGNHDILYYEDSTILKQLESYPIIQLIVALIFIFVAIIAIRLSNKSDQSLMMVGMSKETAHQLGTPISSLLAWIEILKMQDNQPEIIEEVEKDVNRLVKITDRFSKIGNKPELKTENVGEALSNAVNYLRSRSSKNVEYVLEIPDGKIITAPLNLSLFEWVIENLCKNAIDAMQGKGTLTIKLFDTEKHAKIEISDTGKGMSKRYFKRIFRPGFTTKKHGWGLGLSLAQRIVNSYHKGEIYVRNSEVGKGTTFRLKFPKK